MDLKGRHLLKLLDFTPEEILYLVDHADELKAKGCDAYYFPNFEEIENFCLTHCQKGDVLITMGAGDVVNIGETLLGR